MKNREIPLISKKIVSSCLILTMLLYVIMNLIYESKTYAVVQTRENYSSTKVATYKGSATYIEKIEQLKKNHPNWNITMFYTGLDWNQVIKNETTAWHGRNLVSANNPKSWFCSICGDKAYDNGSWRCASEAIVSYYMDPRNSLNEDDLFQFEALSYNQGVQTEEGVKKIIQDVGYMQGSTITYTKTDGSKATLSKSYAQVIMEASKEANISPYHLAARIRQEQGTGSSPSALASGTYSGYVGYYNFLNIRASGNSTATIIANGLNYAKENGLTDPEKSIKAGAKMIAENYIANGQDTLYLQKFDVDANGSLYSHQYMQNLSAAKSEGQSVRQSYQKMGLLDDTNAKIDFIIPIYENMPDTPCVQPGTEGIVTQDVKVKGSDVSVREKATTSSTKIASVNTSDTLLRIEMASTPGDGGYYWDKIVLPDGRKGYIARNYIVEISDITNTNDTMFATTYVYLRNGPGMNGTTSVTMLSTGQKVTRIETGKYNGLDGYDWDRVVLSDGRKGYVASKYLEKQSSGGNTPVTTEQIRVVCPSGLKVRETPGTGSKVLTYLTKGDTATRTAREVSNANGYVWDKITTDDGVEGYVARGDSSGVYFEVIEQGGTSQDPTPSDGTNVKLENNSLLCEPKTTIDTIKEKYKEEEVIVNKPDGTKVTTGEIGTGYSVSIGGNSYTVVKKGDTSGDGIIDARDSLRILKYAVGTYELKDSYAMAGDINGDGVVDARDSLRILKYSVGTFNIEI